MNRNSNFMARQTNILLIDDDVAVRQAVGHALTVENYCVVPAANQQEALREFGNRQIDIVLLDLNPQNEDGFETVRSLTDLQPQLPVVAMTARAEQHEPALAARSVGDAAGDDLEQAVRRLGRAFDDAERHGGGAENLREKKREERVDGLAGRIGRETHPPEKPDGTRKARH